jgi:hypothetical protein
LPVVKNLVVIVARFPVALFIADYGRSHVVVIPFSLVTHGRALIIARVSFTLFSFRFGRSLYSSLWNIGASVVSRRGHGLLYYWLIYFYRLIYLRVLNVRRRRLARNRSLRGATIPVNAYR